MYGPSLYDSAETEATLPSGSGSEPRPRPRPGPRPNPHPAPRPQPGTSYTASVETIDNDRAGGLNFAAGIVR